MANLHSEYEHHCFETEINITDICDYIVYAWSGTD